MLPWAAIFFAIAVAAAVLGFTGIAAGASLVGKVLFVIFAVATIASLVIGAIT